MSRRTAWIVLTAIVVAACATTAATWSRLSQTADEPDHVAIGLEWWARGTYRLDPENPPLSRIAVGFGPYLDGARVAHGADPWQIGTASLQAGGDYETRLALARAGVLPFLAVLLIVVYAWGAWLGDRTSGLVAAAACALVPTVTAHAGLATSDLPHAAMLALALYALCRWWASGQTWRAALAGVAVGLALGTKLSTLAFLPAALALAGAFAIARRPRDGTTAGWRGPRLALALSALLGAAFAIVWALYRFQSGRAIDDGAVKPRLATCGDNAFTHWLATARVPAPELVHGLFKLCAHDVSGHPSYLFGAVSNRGHLGFYLVALAVKTPLPWLALALAACVTTVVLAWRGRAPMRAVPALAAVAILIVASLGKIQIGTRHVIVVYPLLAVAIAAALPAWRARWMHAAVAGALALSLVSAVRAWPDSLGYFNLAAGDEPGTILVDSDLDWGQGLVALRDLARARGVDQLSIAYFGTAPLCDLGLPPLRWLAPGDRPTGWVAISEVYYRGLRDRMYRDPCDPKSAYAVPRAALRDYHWLDAQPLVLRTGGLRVYLVSGGDGQ